MRGTSDLRGSEWGALVCVGHYTSKDLHSLSQPHLICIRKQQLLTCKATIPTNAFQAEVFVHVVKEDTCLCFRRQKKMGSGIERLPS